MSVTVTGTLASVSPAGNPIYVRALLSTGVSGTNTVRLGYQVSGTPGLLMEIEAIPYTGVYETIRLDRILKKYCSTSLPDLSSATIQQDTNFVFHYTVKYGHVFFDTSDGTSDTTDVTEQITAKRALAAAYQWDETIPDLTSDLHAMTNRPAINRVCIGQDDFILIFKRSGTIYIEVTPFAGSVNLTQYNGSQASSNAAYHFPVGPNNALWNFDPSTTHYTVAFYDTDPLAGSPTALASYTYHVEQCCSPTEIREVMWVEPKGSLSSMVFDSVQSVGQTQKTYSNKVPQYDTDASDTPDVQGYEVSTSNGFVKYSFVKTMQYTEGIEAWLDGLQNSKRVYYVTGTDYNKLILDDVQYLRLNNSDLITISVTGRVARNINVI